MVSGLAQCSFTLRPACSLTRVYSGLWHQGLRTFHCFHVRLGCYRLERKLPGGFDALPLEFCAFSRRTKTRSKPRLKQFRKFLVGVLPVHAVWSSPHENPQL